LTGGVGAGGRVAWVLSALPLAVLCPDCAVVAVLTPTSAGWTVQPAADGLHLAGRPLTAGVAIPWQPEGVLEIPGFCRVSRGHISESRNGILT
jgi:hypothetical protein